MIPEPGRDGVEFRERDECPFHSDVGKDGNGLIQIARVKDFSTGIQFQILRCGRCGVGLTSPYPTPETLDQLYKGRSSVLNFDPLGNGLVDKLKDFFARVDLKNIRHATSTRITRILDFGTGNGRFAIQCGKVFTGCQVDAVDFDTEAPPGLNEASIKYINISEFYRNSDKYDLIVLRHLLEHVSDPLAFLSIMVNRLDSGGILYIEVPNLESANIRLFGGITNSFCVPFHLFHFDGKSLSSVIRDAGLECRISQKGMPLAGVILAGLLHQERSLVHQLAGIILHPVQMILDGFLGKPCLLALCYKRDNQI